MTDTDVNDVAGEKLTFLFGDGGSPETYSSSASINTQRAIEMKANLYSGEVPDATNPSGPGFMRRRTKSQDFPFTAAAPAGRYKDAKGKTRTNSQPHPATPAQPFFYPTIRARIQTEKRRMISAGSRAAKQVAALNAGSPT